MTDADRPTVPCSTLPPESEREPMHVELLGLYDAVSRVGVEPALRPSPLPSRVSK